MPFDMVGIATITAEQGLATACCLCMSHANHWSVVNTVCRAACGAISVDQRCLSSLNGAAKLPSFLAVIIFVAQAVRL
eukprot:scaffold43818_cov19-Prasinocladus_malaysianus.AAC.1